MNQLKLFNYDSLRESDFPAYQLAGIERLIREPRLLFMDETGLGKTVQILGLLAALAQIGQLPTTFRGRVLIAMPASLLAQWEAEFVDRVPGITVQVVTGDTLNAKAKKRPSETYPQVELVSYDTLKLENYIEGFKAKAYSVVVLEEAAELKSGEKRFVALMDIARQAKRIYVVSATVLENNPLELWALLAAMQIRGVPPSEKLWGEKYVEWSTPYNFPGAYGRQVYVPAKPIGLKPGAAAEELRDIIAPYLLRRTAEEVGLKMPKVRTRVVLVQLGQAQMDAYNAGLNQSNGGKRHTAMEKACERTGDESAKVDWLVPWVADHPGKKVVVMAEHTQLLDLALARLEDEGIGCSLLVGKILPKVRGGVVDTFREDAGVQVLLGSAVLERGVDGLQAITDTLIIIGSSYNPASVEQAIGRLKRFGSPFDVTHVLMVVADVEHERNKLATLDAKSATAAVVFGGFSTDYRGLAERAGRIDEFVATVDGWSVEEVTHLLGDTDAVGEKLIAELIALRSPEGAPG